MAKKCIPGIVCVENMTLFLLFIILLLVIYLYYSLNFFKMTVEKVNHNYAMPLPNTIPLAGNIGPIQSFSNPVATRNDPFNDPYYPPLKMDSLFFPSTTSDIRYVPKIPINIQTQAPMQNSTSGYSQIGILTPPEKINGKDNMILPLMGRRNINGRDKWQYYTLSNNGNLNTKLPLSYRGRSCTSENGCDEINNNDTVYVEGYKEQFSATVYENGLFSYIPQL